MVMGSCPTVSMPSRNILTLLDRTNVVIASSLTLNVSSWDRIEVSLDNVFSVMFSCPAVRGTSGKTRPLEKTTVVMASCLTSFPVGTAQKYI